MRNCLRSKTQLSGCGERQPQDADDNGTAITAYEFCISMNSDMSAATCYSATTANYTFTGLDAYTTYYVTASATNLAGAGTSSVVNARTPAHAPAGILSSSLPAKPTGFQVTVSSLDFKEPAEGTVQISRVPVQHAKAVYMQARGMAVLMTAANMPMKTVSMRLPTTTEIFILW